MIWQAGSRVRVTPEARFTLTVGITRRETCLLQRGAHISSTTFFVALAVWVLRWLGVARDVLVLAVEITIVEIASLRHVHGAIIGIEALRITMADVLLAGVAIFIATVLRGYKLTAVDIRITWTSDFLFIAAFFFWDTKETSEAVIAWTSTR